MVVEVETFTAELPCAGCLKLLEHVDSIKAKYGDRMEVAKHIRPCEEFSKYSLTVVPAVVFDEGKIKTHFAKVFCGWSGLYFNIMVGGHLNGKRPRAPY